MTELLPPPLKDAAAGDVLSGRTRTLSLARILAFSGGLFDEANWPDVNLHTNAERARQAGLPDIIASGTQSEGMLIGFLISVCGQVWHRSGRLELKFVKPIMVGETVTPKVRLLESISESGGVRLNFEAWCETGKGEVPITGNASCMFAADQEAAKNA